MKTAISRENNFDFLRLLFASLVIVSHSFPLTGVRQLEPLRVISNGQLDLGGFAVKCFFILSGFLIFQSLERSSSLLNYLWKRILRLFPGLFVMLLFVLLVVPFVYTGETPLLENKSYLTYLPRQMMLYNLQDSIDGVFVGMPYYTVNGSLWTICYEFTMYLMIGLFFFVKKNWRLPLLVVLFILFYSIPTFYHPEFLKNYFSKIHLHSPNVYVLGSYFTAGAILSYFAQKIKNNWGGYFLLMSAVTLCLAVYFGFYDIVAPVLLPVLVILVGTSATPYISKLGKYLGDISYGVYIYGWFVQQMLIHIFGFNAYELIIPSLLVSGLLGWLSWHWVEKRALKLKDIVR